MPRAKASLLSANFDHDLRHILITSLQANGADFDPAVSTDELLIADLTIDERRIAAIPRVIHRSPQFTAAIGPLAADQQTAVSDLIRKFEAGEDVNGHLNRRRLRPGQDDDLLADWGIYHFHLSLISTPGDKFLGRTDNLAFAHVTASDVYFVDVLPHQSFAEPKLIETLLLAFPSLAVRYEVKGIIGTEFPAPNNAAQVTALRQVHVNSPVIVNGKPYFGPGGGFVSSGASMRVIVRMVHTKRWIKWLEEIMLQQEGSIRQQLARELPALDPAAFVFGLVRLNDEWLVLEKTTHTGLRF